MRIRRLQLGRTSATLSSWHSPRVREKALRKAACCAWSEMAAATRYAACPVLLRRRHPSPHSACFSAVIKQHGGESLEVQTARHGARKLEHVTRHRRPAARCLFGLAHAAGRCTQGTFSRESWHINIGPVLAVSLLGTSSSSLFASLCTRQKGTSMPLSLSNTRQTTAVGPEGCSVIW